MFATAVLLGLVLAVLFVLELLNAFYEATLSGQVAAAGSEPRRVSLLRWPLVIVRQLLVALMVLLRGVSLWVHELSHALAQLLSGGMPRIVMCRGGGYAQARPWPLGRLGRELYFYGASWGRLVSPLAPLLVGSGLLFGLWWWLTPLRGAGQIEVWMTELATAASTPDGLRTLPGVALGIVRGLGSALLGGGVVAVVCVVGLGLTLASSLTPSSVDYINARWSLPGFGLGLLAASAILAGLPEATLALVGAGLVALVIYRSTSFRPRHWPVLFGTFGATVLAVAALSRVERLGTPTEVVPRAVAALLLLLLVAGLLYVAFIAAMVALSLLALRLAPLWEGLKATPGALRRVFTSIAICTEKNIMFQDRCDYCQCSLREFKRHGCGGRDLDRPRKTSLWTMLRKLSG